ncbi:MAG TPA: hypothetical protein VJL29_08390 [Thermoguttaceae bacterium]|nr:hypothetical protein [Thermoguttaceae bacterium]
MSEYGIHLGRIVFVGLLGTILTVDAVVGLQALYFWQLRSAERSETLYAPDAELESLVETQQARLAEYWIVDPKKGTMAIPIRRAMDMVVDELARSNAEGKTGEDKSHE